MSSYELYAKKSSDDPWTSEDSIGLKMWKSIGKRCRNAVPVRSMTKGKHCLGGYKYGDLALQDGGVSNEKVKYGLSSAGLGLQSR
jgi:hypothetical protein